MLTTLLVALRWPPGTFRVPVLNGQPLRTGDPRVLLAVRNGLEQTPGVVAVQPLGDRFAVAVDDRPLPDPGRESLRLSPGTLDGGSLRFSLVWAEDGGLKTALIDVALEVL